MQDVRVVPRSPQSVRLAKLLEQLTRPEYTARRTAADLAQLRTLLEEYPGLAPAFLEAEHQIAASQSGSEAVRRELSALAVGLRPATGEPQMRDGDR